MRALEFRREIGRYLASRVISRRAPRLWSVDLSPLHHATRRGPTPERPGWIRLEILASGICGSDVRLVTGQDSLALEPEATYPFVPGHEIVGRIGSVPRGVADENRADLTAGARVAVWPVLACRARGITPPCSACATGWEGQCERRDAGWPDRGLSLGFNRQTGGGWSEACLAHTSQLWPLPAPVSDESAVLLDPAATALAALLRGGEGGAQRVLVIGGGTIGLLAGLLHRALALPGRCELLVRHEFQRTWAERHGLRAHRLTDAASFHAWADAEGLTSRRVAGYGHVFQGTFDRVIDAAGTQRSLEWSLHAVRARGLLVMAASTTSVRGWDPTLLWYREITLRGIFDYGPVPWQGRSEHPYAVLIPRLADGTFRPADIVTHHFALDDFRAALATAFHRARHESLKVVFRPTAGSG